MSEHDPWYDDPQPRLLRTLYGEWLAVSEPGAPIGIGVSGLTAEGAREAFRVAAAEWGRLSRLPWPPASRRAPCAT